MTAFSLANYSLIIGDHDTGIWCRHCTGPVYGPDGMYAKFGYDDDRLTLAGLAACAQRHHKQHHREPHHMGDQY